MKRRISLLALSTALACGIATAPASAREDEKVKLDGYAEWHRDGEPALFIVDGQRVHVPESVKFKGSGHAFDVHVIPLGYEMQVKGIRLADGSILAHELRAKPNGIAFMEGTLRQSFDDLEAQFRRRGHVYMSDSHYGELWESGEEVERVRTIASRLAPPYMDPAELRVYVIDNREWNAMAVPNGSIYVFRGLLDDMDDDEVAIVLGHELAHVSHEHSRRQLKRNLIFSAISTGAFVAADQIDTTRHASLSRALPWPARWPGRTATEGRARIRPTESDCAMPTKPATTYGRDRDCGSASRRNTGGSPRQ